MRRKRKLSKAEGQRILWHVLEHLQGILYDLDGELEAIQTIRRLLDDEKYLQAQINKDKETVYNYELIQEEKRGYPKGFK